MRCTWHREWHPALDCAEYEGRHPWQVRPARARTKWGMARSESIPERWTATMGPLAGLTDTAIREGWDRAAPWWIKRYTARGDINREWIIDPVLLRFLGPVRGQRVLDAGCGSGYLARILARRSARVDGVDQSEGLLAAAKAEEARSPLGIRYRRADLARLPHPSGTFDAVVANVVIQDVRRYREAIREIYRVLQPGGRFVFSTTHPAFEAPIPARWVREPRDSERIEDRRYLRVDRYFDRVTVFWAPPGLAPVPSFHRPLRDYFEALSNAGFLVARFEEPYPSAKALERHFRIFADLARIPIFLVLLAVKPDGSARQATTVLGHAGGARRGRRRHRRGRPRPPRRPQ